MDHFNKGFASSAPIKRHSVASPTIEDAGGNNENELNPHTASRFKSPSKKQIPTKSYMNPTISAAVKASVPRKKILGERNEIVDTAGSVSLQRCSSFGSRSVSSTVVDSDDDVVKDFVGESSLEPYDPVKNYLSPRPKFLRYNPDRRRNRRILNLQENDDDRVKISTYFNAGDGVRSSGLQSSESGSPQKPVEEACDVNNEEDEDESGEESEVEEDEEEMDEFGEDRRCSLKGVFKFLFVVIALILATQYICSMNSPTAHTLESVWGVNDWHNRVYGFNFSEVGYGPVMEQNLLLGRLKEEDACSRSDRLEVYETIEELAETDDYVHQDEVETDDSNVMLNDIFQEHEITATKVAEVDYMEAEAETEHDSSHDDLIEEDESNANEKNSQMTDEIEFETASDMEDGLEEEFDDVKTENALIKVASLDPKVALLVAHILVLTVLSVIYCMKGRKSSAFVTTPVEIEGLKDVEPSTNPESVIQEKEDEELFVTTTSTSKVEVEEEPFVTSASTSKVHIPSVELLGEFMFGEEVTSSISAKHYTTNSSIRSTTVSSNQTRSFYMETSTGDSHTVKKQRRKPAEVVTPSPVRRSSRLKTRSIMSP